MPDPIEIEERLLHRLSGGLSPAELSSWARSSLAFSSGDAPTIFAAEEELLADVLKRCAVEADPGFELSAADLEALLRRVAFSGASGVQGSERAGPFLVAWRARLVPARLFPVAGLCSRCGAPGRVARSMLPKARRARGVLACLWCARAFPGRLVAKVGP